MLLPLQYEPFYHPRFGNIKCIRAVEDIPAGAEIFVVYEYEVGESGRWLSSFREQTLCICNNSS